MTDDRFPQWLDAMLDARGYSTSDFSRLSGISEPQVSRMRAGMRPGKPETRRKVARALGLTYQQLLDAVDLWEFPPAGSVPLPVVDAIQQDPALNVEEREALVTMYRVLTRRRPRQP